jgi:hypothetical protein
MEQLEDAAEDVQQHALGGPVSSLPASERRDLVSSIYQSQKMSQVKS